MIQELLNTVKDIQAGAQVDLTWTLVLVGIGVLAIIAAFWAMEH